jgi:hypothetical protein
LLFFCCILPFSGWNPIRKSAICVKLSAVNPPDAENGNPILQIAIFGGMKKKKYVSASTVSVPGVYNVSSGVSQFTVNVAGERRRGLQLRGDILIKCYHRGDVGRETVFACQFHTCAVADYTLSFTRQELDVACNGKSPHPPSLFPTRPGIAPEY